MYVMKSSSQYMTVCICACGYEYQCLSLHSNLYGIVVNMATSNGTLQR